MNAEQLLAHFHRFGDAPDAIPRVRRFILDLAVRGKLVPQDPTDEPALELLKRIADEKARGTKRQQEVPEIDNPEEAIDVPPNWSLVPLIALGSWAIGAGFPTNEQGINDGPFFFLKVSDMNLPSNEKYITASQNCIDEEGAARLRAKIHPPGTIIFPKIGGAIATNKRRILTKGSAIDNNCLGITFSSEIDTEWAYLLLITLDFTRYQAGTAVPALQQGVLERIPVALPPLAEQHRIVAKVDELMALCDRLGAARADREATRDRLAAASLARLNAPDPDPATFADHARFALESLAALTARPDQTKQLRQTILNLAVRGRLVPQDPNDEPASELLARFAATKARTSKGRNWTQGLSISKDQAFCCPQGWAWTRIADTAERVTVGYVGPMKNEYVEIGIPFLRSQNVRANRFREDGLIYVPPKFHQTIIKSALAPGDVVVVRSGNVGTACVIPPTISEANCSDLVVVKKPECVVSTYLCFYLNSLAASHVEAGSVGIALTHFNTKSVATMPLPLPPLAEQHRIVAKVDQLMALCDRLEASLTGAQDHSRRLLDALLAEALTPTEAAMPAEALRVAAHG